MVVTFCGHSNFIKTAEQEEKILAFLEENVGLEPALMLLGGYGAFDSFAYECCKKYKIAHPNISLAFVTPYLTEEYQHNQLKDIEKLYDTIICPDIEDKPPRFAISYRNKYMVEKSDIVIAYVSHAWGGAYTTYSHAKRKGKKIFNLTNFDG